MRRTGHYLVSGALAGAVLAAVPAVRPSAQTRGAVTFSEHVAPIVFNKCTPCHRPGEAAPFALQSYADAKQHGLLMASAVEARIMPPWKAAPGDYAFAGDRRLTEAEIETIVRWADAGMPEGDRKKLPPTPRFTEGWSLGPPDLVVSMPVAFDVPADGPDVYRSFVLPLNLGEDRWVRAIDFRPSARSVVHHSLFFADGTGGARERDARDATPGFAGGMGGFGGRGNAAAALLGLVRQGGGRGGRGGRAGAQGSGADSAGAAIDPAVVNAVGGGLGGYALGAQPRALPDGLAVFVPKGADLVLSTHFHPTGKVEHEKSTVGIYFAKEPPTQAFGVLQLPAVFGVFEGLNIPPGEKNYTIRDSFVLPVDVKAFNTGAHAHYLATRMQLTATLPDGATRTLLKIDDWDFAWQEQYQYKDFVLLPKGTRLDATISYDNSADNPRNPSQPPVRVTWGEQSTDEMGSMLLQIVAAHPEDLPTLQTAYIAHVREAALSGPGLFQLMQQRGARGRGRR
jgi:hypothetical protein